jgi:hypothetical protein
MKSRKKSDPKPPKAKRKKQKKKWENPELIEIVGSAGIVSHMQSEALTNLALAYPYGFYTALG